MAFLVKRSNGIYYLVISQRDRRLWRSTHARNRQEDEAVVRRDFVDLIRSSKGITLSQFRAEFLAYAKANFASSTVEMYQCSIDSFIKVIGDRRLTSYTVKDVEQFKMMRSSTFEQLLLPALHGRAGVGHLSVGRPVAGRWHTVPEQAPEGGGVTLQGRDALCNSSSKIERFRRSDCNISRGLP